MPSLRRILEFDVAVGLIIAIVILGWMPIIDPDFFWHVKNGELIYHSGTLLSKDYFSHTAAGVPVTVPGWISEILFYQVWHWFGELGTITLVMLVLVATWLVMYKTVHMFIDRRESAALLALIGIGLLSPVFAPRPNLFTHLGIALVLFLILRFRQDGSLRGLMWLIPLFALWPNLHYGFLAAIVLIGLFMASAIFDRVLPLDRTQYLQPLLSARFMGVCALAIAATGINPYGFEMYPELIQMTSRAKTAFVSEWQSPDFGEIDTLVILSTVLVYVAMLYLLRVKVSWVVLIVPVAMMTTFFMSIRNLNFWAITFATFVAIVLPNTLLWEKLFANRRAIDVGTNADGLGLSQLINAAAVLVTTATFYFTSPILEQKWSETGNAMLPVRATDFLIREVPDGLLFNRYAAGGYLLWRTYPKFPVFVDGRYFPYSDKVLEDYLKIHNAKPGSRELIDRYKIEVFVVASNSGVSEMLYLSDDHRLVYEDGDFSIFVVDNEKYRSVKTIERKLDFNAR